jgi:hypothetical protein
VIGPSSDLVLDDLTNGNQSDPPAGVNTKFWEWRPSISGNWLLFTRRNFSPKHRLDSVILFNLNTFETRTLATSTNPKHYLASGQVSGNYAVWTYCAASCNVYLYDITSQSTQQIPLAGSAQFDPSVAADGTMYFTRSGVFCGQDVSIVRRDFNGTETTINALPAGKSAWYDSATTNLDGSDTVYFGRVSCKRGYPSDVYRIDGADTAVRVPVTADVRHADDAGRFPPILAGPDAGP